MRKPLLALALLALLALASVPKAGAWTSRTHGHQATNAFDALPDLYKENLDDTMLYSASLSPDDWRQPDWPVQMNKSYDASTNPGSAGNAYDSSSSTYWEAAGGAGEWVEVDLLQAYTIEWCRFTGVENQATVNVQTSSNGTSWYNVYTVTDSGPDETADWPYARENRYWRLYCSDLSQGNFKVTDIFLYSRADNAHKFTWIKPRGIDWLYCARDNYINGYYDNAIYCMGIAAHYLSDAMTLVHQDDVWSPSMQTQQPSGWSLHKHFEEQARYHEPATPSPKKWRNTLDNYLENYLSSYLDNFAENASSYWVYWVTTRDCELAKGHIDAVTQLIYDAWYSMLYELLGPPGGPEFSAPESEQGTQASVVEAEPSWELPLAMWVLSLISILTIVFTLNGRSRPKRRIRGDERGITPVVGGVLVIALLVIAATTLITTWIPQLERKNEADHMDSVRETWQELQAAIISREGGEIEVKMSADPANVFGLFGQQMNPGNIRVTPAKFENRIAPVADMYVDEATGEDYDNGYLWAQSQVDNNKRAFLRFDLSVLPLDAGIEEARLLIYTQISKFPHTYEGVTGYSAVPPLLVVAKVSDDSWSEDPPPDWPGPELRDVMGNEDWPFDDTWEIGYDMDLVQDNIGMWYTFNLTDYVRGQRKLDNLVSIGIKAARENSSLQRYAMIWSKDNEISYRRPHLLITYTRGDKVGAPTFDDWGTIADGGSVVFEAHNKQYDDFTFTFESGGLIMQRYGGGTLMVSNPDLIVGERVEDSDDIIKIYVNRYRIMNRAHYSSLSKAMLRVTMQENRDLRRETTLDNIMVAVHTDYPNAWRGDHPLVEGGYFTDLASRFPDSYGSLDYLLEAWYSDWGDVAEREFHATAISIYGLRQAADVQDIIFVERVYDVRVYVTAV